MEIKKPLYGKGVEIGEVKNKKKPIDYFYFIEIKIIIKLKRLQFNFNSK